LAVKYHLSASYIAVSYHLFASYSPLHPPSRQEITRQCRHRLGKGAKIDKLKLNFEFGSSISPHAVLARKQHFALIPTQFHICQPFFEHILACRCFASFSWSVSNLPVSVTIPTATLCVYYWIALLSFQDKMQTGAGWNFMVCGPKPVNKPAQASGNSIAGITLQEYGAAVLGR
jgi:hypothetical protein